MRKWTQQIRLALSEKIKEEVETKFRLELSEANPDEPFTGDFSDEHREQIEKRIAEKYDVQLIEAYDESVKKAQFLLKLNIPKSFMEEKEKESMELVKTGIMISPQDHLRPTQVGLARG